jgi:hypothetical protein
MVLLYRLAVCWWKAIGGAQKKTSCTGKEVSGGARFGSYTHKVALFKAFFFYHTRAGDFKPPGPLFFAERSLTALRSILN